MVSSDNSTLQDNTTSNFYKTQTLSSSSINIPSLSQRTTAYQSSASSSSLDTLLFTQDTNNTPRKTTIRFDLSNLRPKYDNEIGQNSVLIDNYSNKNESIDQISDSIKNVEEEDDDNETTISSDISFKNIELEVKYNQNDLNLEENKQNDLNSNNNYNNNNNQILLKKKSFRNSSLNRRHSSALELLSQIKRNIFKKPKDNYIQVNRRFRVLCRTTSLLDKMVHHDNIVSQTCCNSTCNNTATANNNNRRYIRNQRLVVRRVDENNCSNVNIIGQSPSTTATKRIASSTCNCCKSCSSSKLRVTRLPANNKSQVLSSCHSSSKCNCCAKSSCPVVEPNNVKYIEICNEPIMNKKRVRSPSSTLSTNNLNGILNLAQDVSYNKRKAAAVSSGQALSCQSMRRRCLSLNYLYNKRQGEMRKNNSHKISKKYTKTIRRYCSFSTEDVDDIYMPSKYNQLESKLKNLHDISDNSEQEEIKIRREYFGANKKVKYNTTNESHIYQNEPIYMNENVQFVQDCKQKQEKAYFYNLNNKLKSSITNVVRASHDLALKNTSSINRNLSLHELYDIRRNQIRSGQYCYNINNSTNNQLNESFTSDDIDNVYLPWMIENYGRKLAIEALKRRGNMIDDKRQCQTTIKAPRVSATKFNNIQSNSNKNNNSYVSQYYANYSNNNSTQNFNQISSNQIKRNDLWLIDNDIRKYVSKSNRMETDGCEIDEEVADISITDSDSSSDDTRPIVPEKINKPDQSLKNKILKTINKSLLSSELTGIDLTILKLDDHVRKSLRKIEKKALERDLDLDLIRSFSCSHLADLRKEDIKYTNMRLQKMSFNLYGSSYVYEDIQDLYMPKVLETYKLKLAIEKEKVNRNNFMNGSSEFLSSCGTRSAHSPIRMNNNNNNQMGFIISQQPQVRSPPTLTIHSPPILSPPTQTASFRTNPNNLFRQIIQEKLNEVDHIMANEISSSTVKKTTTVIHRKRFTPHKPINQSINEENEEEITESSEEAVSTDRDQDDSMEVSAEEESTEEEDDLNMNDEDMKHFETNNHNQNMQSTSQSMKKKSTKNKKISSTTKIATNPGEVISDFYISNMNYAMRYSVEYVTQVAKDIRRRRERQQHHEEMSEENSIRENRANSVDRLYAVRREHLRYNNGAEAEYNNNNNTSSLSFTTDDIQDIYMPSAIDNYKRKIAVELERRRRYAENEMSEKMFSPLSCRSPVPIIQDIPVQHELPKPSVVLDDFDIFIIKNTKTSIQPKDADFNTDSNQVIKSYQPSIQVCKKEDQQMIENPIYKQEKSIGKLNYVNIQQQPQILQKYEQAKYGIEPYINQNNQVLINKIETIHHDNNEVIVSSSSPDDSSSAESSFSNINMDTFENEFYSNRIINSSTATMNTSRHRVIHHQPPIQEEQMIVEEEKAEQKICKQNELNYVNVTQVKTIQDKIPETRIEQIQLEDGTVLENASFRVVPQAKKSVHIIEEKINIEHVRIEKEFIEPKTVAITHNPPEIISLSSSKIKHEQLEINRASESMVTRQDSLNIPILISHPPKINEAATQIERIHQKVESAIQIEPDVHVENIEPVKYVEKLDKANVSSINTLNLAETSYELQPVDYSKYIPPEMNQINEANYKLENENLLAPNPIHQEVLILNAPKQLEEKINIQEAKLIPQPARVPIEDPHYFIEEFAHKPINSQVVISYENASEIKNINLKPEIIEPKLIRDLHEKNVLIQTIIPLNVSTLNEDPNLQLVPPPASFQADNLTFMPERAKCNNQENYLQQSVQTTVPLVISNANLDELDDENSEILEFESKMNEKSLRTHNEPEAKLEKLDKLTEYKNINIVSENKLDEEDDYNQVEPLEIENIKSLNLKELKELNEIVSNQTDCTQPKVFNVAKRIDMGTQQEVSQFAHPFNSVSFENDIEYINSKENLQNLQQSAKTLVAAVFNLAKEECVEDLNQHAREFIQQQELVVNKASQKSQEEYLNLQPTVFEIASLNVPISNKTDEDEKLEEMETETIGQDISTLTKPVVSLPLVKPPIAKKPLLYNKAKNIEEQIPSQNLADFTQNIEEEQAVYTIDQDKLTQNVINQEELEIINGPVEPTDLFLESVKPMDIIDLDFQEQICPTIKQDNQQKSEQLIQIDQTSTLNRPLIKKNSIREEKCTEFMIEQIEETCEPIKIINEQLSLPKIIKSDRVDQIGLGQILETDSFSDENTLEFNIEYQKITNQKIVERSESIKKKVESNEQVQIMNQPTINIINTESVRTYKNVLEDEKLRITTEINQNIQNEKTITQEQVLIAPVQKLEQFDEQKLDSFYQPPLLEDIDLKQAQKSSVKDEIANNLTTVCTLNIQANLSSASIINNLIEENEEEYFKLDENSFTSIKNLYENAQENLNRKLIDSNLNEFKQDFKQTKLKTYALSRQIIELNKDFKDIEYINENTNEPELPLTTIVQPELFNRDDKPLFSVPNINDDSYLIESCNIIKSDETKQTKANISKESVHLSKIERIDSYEQLNYPVETEYKETRERVKEISNNQESYSIEQTICYKNNNEINEIYSEKLTYLNAPNVEDVPNELNERCVEFIGGENMDQETNVRIEKEMHKINEKYQVKKIKLINKESYVEIDNDEFLNEKCSNLIEQPVEAKTIVPRREKNDLEEKPADKQLLLWLNYPKTIQNNNEIVKEETKNIDEKLDYLYEKIRTENYNDPNLITDNNLIQIEKQISFFISNQEHLKDPENEVLPIYFTETRPELQNLILNKQLNENTANNQVIINKPPLKLVKAEQDESIIMYDSLDDLDQEDIHLKTTTKLSKQELNLEAGVEYNKLEVLNRASELETSFKLNENVNALNNLEEFENVKPTSQPALKDIIPKAQKSQSSILNAPLEIGLNDEIGFAQNLDNQDLEQFEQKAYRSEIKKSLNQAISELEHMQWEQTSIQQDELKPAKASQQKEKDMLMKSCVQEEICANENVNHLIDSNFNVETSKENKEKSSIRKTCTIDEVLINENISKMDDNMIVSNNLSPITTEILSNLDSISQIEYHCNEEEEDDNIEDLIECKNDLIHLEKQQNVNVNETSYINAIEQFDPQLDYSNETLSTLNYDEDMDDVVEQIVAKIHHQKEHKTSIVHIETQKIINLDNLIRDDKMPSPPPQTASTSSSLLEEHDIQIKIENQTAKEEKNYQDESISLDEEPSYLNIIEQKEKAIEIINDELLKTTVIQQETIINENIQDLNNSSQNIINECVTKSIVFNHHLEEIESPQLIEDSLLNNLRDDFSEARAAQEFTNNELYLRNLALNNETLKSEQTESIILAEEKYELVTFTTNSNENLKNLDQISQVNFYTDAKSLNEFLEEQDLDFVVVNNNSNQIEKASMIVTELNQAIEEFDPQFNSTCETNLEEEDSSSFLEPRQLDKIHIYMDEKLNEKADIVAHPKEELGQLKETEEDEEDSSISETSSKIHLIETVEIVTHHNTDCVGSRDDLFYDNESMHIHKVDVNRLKIKEKPEKSSVSLASKYKVDFKREELVNLKDNHNKKEDSFLNNDLELAKDKVFAKKFVENIIELSKNKLESLEMMDRSFRSEDDLNNETLMFEQENSELNNEFDFNRIATKSTTQILESLSNVKSGNIGKHIADSLIDCQKPAKSEFDFFENSNELLISEGPCVDYNVEINYEGDDMMMNSFKETHEEEIFENFTNRLHSSSNYENNSLNLDEEDEENQDNDTFKMITKSNNNNNNYFVSSSYYEEVYKHQKQVSYHYIIFKSSL